MNLGHEDRRRGREKADQERVSRAWTGQRAAPGAQPVKRALRARASLREGRGPSSVAHRLPPRAWDPCRGPPRSKASARARNHSEPASQRSLTPPLRSRRGGLGRAASSRAPGLKGQCSLQSPVLSPSLPGDFDPALPTRPLQAEMCVSKQGFVNVFEALVHRNRALGKQKTNKQLKKKKR